MKNWLTRRMAWVETQSKGTSAGNRDFAKPPEFNQFGGEVSSNFILRISDPNNWARSTIYYTTDGTDPRVPGNSRGIVTTLIKEDSNCEVLVPSEANGGSTLTVSEWTNSSTPPNSAKWTSGTQGVGIERSPSGTYDSNIGVDVEEEMYRINPTVYIRVPFNVTQEQIESFTQLTLRVKYDDSFVAYLNGEEVTRDAERSPADLTWNSRATSTHSDSLALTFIEFDITPFIGSLKAGENMLALHGLNAGQNSSDALWRYELIATAGSGNSPSPISLSYDSPIKLEGGVEVKARTFDGVDWSPISSAIFKVNTIPASANNLVVSEINYRPEPATDDEKAAGFSSRGDFEFIELLNINTTRSINLEGVTFAGGVDFTFDANLAAEALVLPPGGRVVLVDNIDAFNFRYQSSRAVIGGNFGGNLSNDGEQVHIIAANGTTIKDFTYNDVAPWPTTPDGDGYTLTLVDPDNNPDHSDPNSWTASANIGGSPGRGDGEGFNGDPSEDQDGDGLNAFLEYAFGTSDSDTKSKAFPSIKIDSLSINNELAEYLVFEFQKNANASGINYQIQTSNDLKTWSSASEEFTTLSSQNNDDGTESVIYRSNEKFQENSNPKFYRLNVTIE
ncbi:MAG: lamin tail domain-containing protein, partial [Verrucomicrobiota bacterium]|nr:lamin tail domain-containing protein [Verrucomicrobiota bacterium]